MNLWFHVENDNGTVVVRLNKALGEGITYGVQWELRLKKSGGSYTAEIYHTKVTANPTVK